MNFGRKVVLSVGVMAAAVLGTVDASACLRAMESPAERPDKPDAPHLVAQAEKALDANKLAVATASMLKTFPAIRVAQKPAHVARKDEVGHLENRALRIVALASVRSAGAFGVSSGAPEAKKKANLEWAVAVLRKLNAARAGDASLQADLGEALAKSPATQKEALEILGKLANDDLIGSPQAYAALAKLRAANGENEKSAEAVKRCEGMTSTPSICQPGSAKPATPPAVPANVKTPPRVEPPNRA